MPSRGRLSRRARFAPIGIGRVPDTSGTLLLLGLLLHPLYLRPHQVSGLTQHLDRLALTRVVELHHVLYLPDFGESSSQPLGGTQLLLLLLGLLLLGLLLLLLIAFRHSILPHTVLSPVSSQAGASRRTRSGVPHPSGPLLVRPGSSAFRGRPYPRFSEEAPIRRRT